MTALERTRSAAQRFRVLGDPWALGQVTAAELRALAAVGEVEEALDRLDRDQEAGSAGLPLNALRAQLLVHVGHPDALPAALHLRGVEGIAEQIVANDTIRTLGLAMLQAGRTDEALAQMADLDGAGSPSEHADAGALALALAASGRGDEVAEPSAEWLRAGTYLDRLQHRVGFAFARLQAGAPDAVEAFDAVVADADLTESRLDQAIVRLARAHAWRALGRDDAEEAFQDARSRLAAVGTEALGWERVFVMASGAGA
jgi:hypothetical protein